MNSPPVGEFRFKRRPVFTVEEIKKNKQTKMKEMKTEESKNINYMISIIIVNLYVYYYNVSQPCQY